MNDSNMLTEITDEVAKVSQRLENVVTKADIAPVAKRLAELEGEVTALKSTGPYITYPRYSKVKNFKTEKEAHDFGRWFLAAAGIQGNGQFKELPSVVKSMDYIRRNFKLEKAQIEGDNTLGGYLVPPDFDNAIIDLREKRGIARQLAKIVPMASDTRTCPRRTEGLTAYWPAERGSITDSDKGWDQVQLTAKKLAAMVRYSSELNEDAVISIGDDLAAEIAYAFADKEDECYFNGDGSSTYGGITGVREKLLGLSSTRSQIAGLFVGSGNEYSELTVSDFLGVVGLLPQYADTNMARWVMHRSFYYNVAVKEAYEAGGVTKEEIVNGQRTPIYLGYPVLFSQVMPKTQANDQVCALLGDFSRGTMLGTRRQLTVAIDSSRYFDTDELAIRGTQRFDIVVHDVGNAHATAASEVPGPIVGLLTAAS
jgi:HK97 family phage major capsid protein